MLHRIEGLKLGLALAAVLASALPAGNSMAQAWPGQKAITVVSPAPPGGVLDNLLRSTSELVSRKIGQAIVLESKSGGAGVPAAQAVTGAPPDGYVIAANYASHVLNPYAIKGLPYDTFRDFVPVTRLANLTLLLLAPASAPYSDVPSLIKYAQENPGKISFGVPGLGGSVHFGFELFASVARISVESIPYRGEAPVIPDLLTGRVTLTVLSSGTAKPHIESGKVKVLATFAEKRPPGFPQVPTVTEAVPAYKPLPTWYGLIMRAGTPQAVVDRLAAEYRVALEDPVVKARLEAAGLVPVGSTPAEFAAQLREEHERYGEVIRSTGFKFQ